ELLSQAVVNIVTNSIVNIYGQNGVGKTHFVRELCYYLSARNIFSGGIKYLSLSNCKNEKDVAEVFENEGLHLKAQEIVKGKKNGDKDGKMLLVLDELQFVVTYSDAQ